MAYIALLSGALVNIVIPFLVHFLQSHLQKFTILPQSEYCNQHITRPQGYKTFFMLNSAEREILNTHKYENIKKFGFFLGSDKPRMLFLSLIVVGILTFMSRKNFMLS